MGEIGAFVDAILAVDDQEAKYPANWHMSRDMRTYDAVVLLGVPFYIVLTVRTPTQRLPREMLMLLREDEQYRILMPATLEQAINILFYRTENVTLDPPFQERMRNMIGKFVNAPDAEKQWYDFKKEMLYYVINTTPNPEAVYNALCANHPSRHSWLLRVAAGLANVPLVTALPWNQMCFVELMDGVPNVKKTLTLQFEPEENPVARTVKEFGRISDNSHHGGPIVFAYIPVNPQTLFAADLQLTAQIEAILYCNRHPETEQQIPVNSYHCIVKREGHKYCDYRDTRRQLIKAIAANTNRMEESTKTVLTMLMAIAITADLAVRMEVKTKSEALVNYAIQLGATKNYVEVPANQRRILAEGLGMPELAPFVITIKQSKEYVLIVAEKAGALGWTRSNQSTLDLLDIPFYAWTDVPFGKLDVTEIEKGPGAIIYGTPGKATRVLRTVEQEEFFSVIRAKGIGRPRPGERIVVTEEMQYWADLYRALVNVGSDTRKLQVYLGQSLCDIFGDAMAAYNFLFTPQLSNASAMHVASNGQIDVVSAEAWVNMNYWRIIQNLDRSEQEVAFKILNLYMDIPIDKKQRTIKLNPKKPETYGRAKGHLYYFLPTAERPGETDLSLAIAIEAVLRDMAFNGPQKINDEDTETLVYLALMVSEPTYVRSKVVPLQVVAQEVQVRLNDTEWTQPRIINA